MNQLYKIKSLVIIAVVAAMATACNESYPGIDYDMTHGELGIHNEDETRTRTPIMLFANQQNFFTVSTRGTGPFTSETLENKLTNATFYVFAFRFGRYNSGPSGFQNETDFTQTRYAEGYTQDREFVHCLLDGPKYHLGQPTGLTYGGTGELHFEDGTSTDFIDDDLHKQEAFYYSGDYQTVPYDFFAYYVDDISLAQYHRDADRIWYDITLDGTQDLLCGYAPRINEDVLKSRYASRYKELSRAEINNICNYGGYCTYTAQLGIHPYVNVGHQLTQLEFEAFPGDSTANSITILGIRIESQTSGRLVVASRNLEDVGFSAYDSKQFLSLRDPHDGLTTPKEMTPTKTAPYDKTIDEWTKQEPTKLGGCLMLNPQESYRMEIKYQQTIRKVYTGSSVVAEKDTVLTAHYEIKAPHQEDEGNKRPDGTFIFMPGKTYKVRVAVFGLKPIEVWTSIEGWQQAGNIDLGDTFQTEDQW